jgi:hypothetical protein
MLLLMLVKSFKRLNAFFGKCCSQLSALELLSVKRVDDFLGDAMRLEDDEGVAFQHSVRVPSKIYVLDGTAG